MVAEDSINNFLVRQQNTLFSVEDDGKSFNPRLISDPSSDKSTASTCQCELTHKSQQGRQSMPKDWIFRYAQTSDILGPWGTTSGSNGPSNSIPRSRRSHSDATPSRMDATVTPPSQIARCHRRRSSLSNESKETQTLELGGRSHLHIKIICGRWHLPATDPTYVFSPDQSSLVLWTVDRALSHRLFLAFYAVTTPATGEYRGR